MLQFASRTLLIASLLVVAGCANPSTPAPGSRQALEGQSVAVVAKLIAESNHPVVTDLGHVGGPSVAMRIVTPKTGFVVQDVQHRWVVADVDHYVATLYVLNADGSTTQAADPVSVPALSGADANASTTTVAAPVAAFTGLENNVNYRIKLDAWGSNAAAVATRAEQQVNVLDKGNTADYTFQEDAQHNIENAVTRNVTVTLDPMAFDGSANTTVGVTDGPFVPKSNKPQGAVPMAVTGGVTTYSSEYGPFSDVFAGGHWASAGAGGGWINREFDGAYRVTEIDLQDAGVDPNFGPNDSLVIKLEQTDGTWVTVDSATHSSPGVGGAPSYHKVLTTPVTAKGFRLELTSTGPGWSSADNFSVKGYAVK